MAARLVWVPLGTVVYLSFLDALSTSEVVAGVLVTGGALWVSTAVFRSAELAYSPQLPRLWRLPTVVRITAREAWMVTAALVRHLLRRSPIAGEVVAIPVSDAPVKGGGGLAFDAAITLEAGLAPNTFIVWLDEDESELLVHQLVSRPHPERSFPRWAP